MPSATEAGSRLSSPESEDTAGVEDTPPAHATGGRTKRPAAEAGEAANPAKRSAVLAPQADASVVRVQAAWRGFRVRGEGVAALARSQSDARREHARSERAAAVDALESQQQRLLGAFQVARRPRLLFSRTKTRAGPRPAAASPGAAPRALAATGRAARQLPRRGGQS